MNENALDQMESAIKKASIMRLLRSTHLISELRQRKNMFIKAPPGADYTSLGEKIRTEVCLVDEDSTAWEEILLKPGVFEQFVQDDPERFVAGPLMTYIRSLNLVTDFLENDRTIPSGYPEQNLNRALNQFTLLEQMENHLQENYQFDLYVIDK